MTTYSYVSTMPGLTDIIEGVSFTANIPINYSTDQFILNKHVPARLSRFVDGVLSNTDLVIPNVVSAQERYNARQELSPKNSLLSDARKTWLSRVAILKAENLLVPNGGFGGANTLRFVNPEHSINGNGDSPLPATGVGLTGAFNAMPATALNTTYFIAEGTSIGPLEIAQDGVMIATYGRNSTATVIQRVTDSARVATIDGAGGTWGVRSTANKANWGLSGIRVTNVAGSGCDGVQLGAISSNTASANCFAEYVYIDNLTGVAGNGAGIVSRGTQTIVRFCTVRVSEAEPIYCGENGTAPSDNPQIYGNDVEITSLTGDGPDGIQVINQVASTLSASIRIEANWVNVSHQNCKYGIIATHTPTPARVLIAHNVIQCADVSVLPYVTGVPTQGNNQGGIYCSVNTTATKGVQIVGNIILNSEYAIRYVPASSGGSCEVRGNLCWFNGLGTPLWYGPIGIYLTANTTVASLVEHNTIVIDNPANSINTSRGIITVANAAAHQFNANIVLGPWKYGIQKGSTTTDSYNVSYGATTANFVNSATTPVAGGTGSSELDPGIVVGAFYPEALSPSVPSTIRAYPIDLFGNSYVGLPGAVQY
jgi:hypothetical protein